MSEDYQGYTVVQDMRSLDLTVYGINSNSAGLYVSEDNETVIVLEPNCPITEDQI